MLYLIFLFVFIMFSLIIFFFIIWTKYYFAKNLIRKFGSIFVREKFPFKFCMYWLSDHSMNNNHIIHWTFWKLDKWWRAFLFSMRILLIGFMASWRIVVFVSRLYGTTPCGGFDSGTFGSYFSFWVKLISGNSIHIL